MNGWCNFTIDLWKYKVSADEFFWNISNAGLEICARDVGVCIICTDHHHILAVSVFGIRREKLFSSASAETLQKCFKSHARQVSIKIRYVMRLREVTFMQKCAMLLQKFPQSAQLSMWVATHKNHDIFCASAAARWKAWRKHANNK